MKAKLKMNEQENRMSSLITFAQFFKNLGIDTDNLTLQESVSMMMNVERCIENNLRELNNSRKQD